MSHRDSKVLERAGPRPYMPLLMTKEATSPVRAGESVVPAGSLAALRTELSGWRPAAGPIGFEGLVAQALAAFTGQTFRLARSGAQFGRDAATPRAPFAIAMEAKRYNDSVPLEALAGKASLAAFALADRIDLWVLAATVEVSEPSQQMLAELLDEKGISLLILDWNATGLPSLAVLLAAVRDQIFPWVAENAEGDLGSRLDALLAAVAADHRFEDERRKLVDQLAPATIGLGVLRDRNGDWLDRRFGDPAMAQQDFSQFLAPNAGHAVRRVETDRKIAEAVALARARADGHALVVVLGGEGAGKSWSVVRWWLDQEARPILLLSVGQVASLLSPRDEPIDMLARLAALQTGRRDDASVIRWRRRLENWSDSGNGRERFVVLVDGLNETSGKPWATILRGLAPAVRDLGGVLIATCREGYWKREVESRLGLLQVSKVTVDDYSDDEFADAMRLHGIDAGSLPPRLSNFMRNPRICALAVSLIGQLETIEDLGVERLLMEYWRARLMERGDLVGHDDIDFRNLLVTHAREYRERPGTDFKRDEWRLRSGAAQRGDGRNLADDLTDIEEGRFFDPVAGAYKFQPEALEFALGLLVADEVRDAIRRDPTCGTESLERIIDAVRSFDMVSDILTAGLAIATLDSDYPDAGIEVLITGWMSLQNLVDQSFQSVIPYVSVRPKPFFDAYERRDLDRDDGRFLYLLLEGAETRDTIATEFDARLTRWLGSWTRHQREWGSSGEQSRRREQRLAGIDARLDAFAPSERAVFDALCSELPNAAGLAGAAVMRLAGAPQAAIAPGVVAFALASTVAGDHRAPFADLEWAVRLNRIDHRALVENVRAAIAPWMRDEASPTARAAAVTALRLLASIDEQRDADRLSPPVERQGGRHNRYFVDDPIDPGTGAPDNLEATATRLDEIEPSSVWTDMSTTAEDHDLKDVLPGLVRFDAAAATGKLVAIARSAHARCGMPLRQLSWHLPWLSPLLDDEALASVRSAASALIEDPGRVPADDAHFVTAMMVEALMPHLDAEGQLDLLQALPPAMPYYFRFDFLAKEMESDVAARRLAALRGADPRIRERTLLFLAGRTASLPSAALCRELEDCLASDDEDIVAAAAEYIRRCDHGLLDDAILDIPLPEASDRSWRAAVRRSAFSKAVVRRDRADMLDRLPIEHLDGVAARMPAAQERLADTIDALIDRFGRPLATPVPVDAVIRLDIDEESQDEWLNLADAGDARPASLTDLASRFGEEGDRQFETRQEFIYEQYEHFMSGLERENAVALARRPLMIGLDHLAMNHSERYAGFLHRLLVISNETALRQIQNLGFALANGYAGVDPALAAQVFEKLWHVGSHVQIRVGPARVWLRDIALFGAPASSEIDDLRRQAFREANDDFRLEQLVVAAERAGAGAWLDDFIIEAANSPLPADQALAITIAGLRSGGQTARNVLGSDWPSGFIGAAARAARARFSSWEHAGHWLDLARGANDPAEMWRYLELAIAGADRRLLLQIDDHLRERLRSFGGDVLPRLEKAVDKVSKDAEKTLYGSKKPVGALAELLRR